MTSHDITQSTRKGRKMTLSKIIDVTTAALVVVSAAAALALTIILILAGPAERPCPSAGPAHAACEETRP
jgi:hypothetical protein